jgi:hypothetical protein
VDNLTLTYQNSNHKSDKGENDILYFPFCILWRALLYWFVPYFRFYENAFKRLCKFKWENTCIWIVTECTKFMILNFSYKTGSQHNWSCKLPVLCLHELKNMSLIFLGILAIHSDRLYGLVVWLQIQGSGFDSWCLQIFWDVVGFELASLSLVSTTEELLGRKGVAPV